jgi:SWI/SNF-related matrix-associated actin-dependent regulator 1 of chromatin subfamily A
MLTPFILRRKKIHVLQDMPDKYEVVVRCGTTEKQRECYKNLLRVSKKAIAEEGGDDEPQGRAMANVIMQLRKISLHPLLASGDYSIFYPANVRVKVAEMMFKKTTFFQWADGSRKSPEQKRKDVREELHNMMDYRIGELCLEFKAMNKFELPWNAWMEAGKVTALFKILQRHAGVDVPDDTIQVLVDEEGLEKAPSSTGNEKVLVFSQFIIMLDILEVILGHYGVPFVRLDGSTSTMERQSIIDDFEKSSDLKVFLLSTKAGGFGINLTSASVVVLFDIDFNPFNDQQAEDRAHRVGQTRDVTVYKLLSKDTIEERIWEVARQKVRLDQSMSTLQATGDASEEENLTADGRILQALKDALNESS